MARDDHHERVIRWSTAGAVIGVAAVAAVASYEHAYALVRAHGEVGWTGRLVPLTVDGLIYASSMVMLATMATYAMAANRGLPGESRVPRHPVVAQCLWIASGLEGCCVPPE